MHSRNRWAKIIKTTLVTSNNIVICIKIVDTVFSVSYNLSRNPIYPVYRSYVFKLKYTLDICQRYVYFNNAPGICARQNMPTINLLFSLTFTLHESKP